MKTAEKNIGMTVEMVTPEIAEKYLASSLGNRRIFRDHVVRFVRVIKEGLWDKEQGYIKFGNGRLVDGHHRLRAIAESGQIVEVRIMRGADMIQNDPPARRWSPSDFANREGIPSAHNYSAAGHVISKLEKPGPINNGVLLSIEEWRERFIPEVPMISYWITSLHRYKKSKRNLSSSELAGFLYYVHSNKDAPSPIAEEFVEKLTTGADLNEDHPILILRERLTEIKTKGSAGYQAKFVALAKCWNAFVTGKKMKKVQVSPGEPMPMIVRV